MVLNNKNNKLYIELLEPISSYSLASFIDTTNSDSAIVEIRENEKTLVYEKITSQKKEYVDYLSVFNNDDIEHNINIFIGDVIVSSFLIPSKKTLFFYKNIGFSLNSIEGSSKVDMPTLVETNKLLYFKSAGLGKYSLAEYEELYLADGTIKKVSNDAQVVFDSDIRGGARTANERITAISNIVSPNAMGFVSGEYYDNAFSADTSLTLAGAANRMDLAPFYTHETLPINLIGISVATAVAASTCKIIIYSSTSDGLPNALLYESGYLDCSTTGYKSVVLSFSFAEGIKYYVGVRHSSTAGIRSINPTSALNMGLAGSNGTTYYTLLRKTLTYATPAPSVWGYNASDRVAATAPPSIRFRKT